MRTPTPNTDGEARVMVVCPWKLGEEQSTTDTSYHTICGHWISTCLYTHAFITPPLSNTDNSNDRYKCHINFELCNSVECVKYMYKYVYKGYDRVMYAITPSDESERRRQQQQRQRITSGGFVPYNEVCYLNCVYCLKDV